MIATFESNLRKEKERKTLNERYLAIAIQQDEVESYRKKLAEEDGRHAENLRIINARYAFLLIALLVLKAILISSSILF